MWWNCVAQSLLHFPSCRGAQSLLRSAAAWPPQRRREAEATPGSIQACPGYRGFHLCWRQWRLKAMLELWTESSGPESSGRSEIVTMPTPLWRA